MKYCQIFVALMVGLLLTACGTKYTVYQNLNHQQIAKRQSVDLQSSGRQQKTYFNGTYEGEMANGLFHGQGVFTWNSGHRYEGGYLRGKMHGQGTFSWPDGSSYTGTFANGRRDGQGIIRFADGRKFTATFANGLLRGEGEMKLAKGGKVVGVFGQDRSLKERPDILPPTSGTVYFARGGSFSGELIDNLPGMAGTYYDSRGNLRQGKGHCITAERTEPCELIDGKRVDQVHLMRIEQAKLRKMLEESQKQQKIAKGAVPEFNARRVPEPIFGNSGRYMCPYTQDGVLAKWTDMMVSAKIGTTAGSVVGTTAGALVGKEVGEQLLDNVPFGGLLGGIVGGAVGNSAGKKAGKQVGLAAAGGMENVRRTSDLSFNSLDEMAVYLYANHSRHEHFQEAIKAANEVYPDFLTTYKQATRNL